MRRLHLITALLLMSAAVRAQDFRATISGQVTDPSKAAVPGAIVKAVQTATNESGEATTDADGYYTLPLLLPGQYVLEVSAQGFKNLRREGITLLVNDRLNLPLTLQLGEVSTTVTVSAEIETIETATASRGTHFDSTETSEYPLNGRQVYMLMEMAPGVLYANEEFSSTGSSGNRGWDANDNFVMNGGVKGSNQFLLNGASVSMNGQFHAVPNLEAVQEFKVMMNTYDAQYGRTGGGTINTTLKSGSNSWHGSLFEYLRNDKFDANRSQNNIVGAPRGKHIQNQFGGTIGGRLRRDKDFIFGSFEGFREIVPFPVVSDTPPLDLRDGQGFSRYKINIYDPLTGHACVAGVDGKSCSGPYIRNAFPGNVIPQSRISAIGTKILSLYPAPNAPGLTQNYFATDNTGRYRYNQVMGRWDHLIGTDRIYAVASFQKGHEWRNNPGFPMPAAYGNMDSQRQPQHYVADWTHMLSPNSILDFRASFSRFTQFFPDGMLDGTNITAKDLGIKMPRPPTVNYAAAPRIQLDTYDDIIGNQYSWSTANSLTLAPSITRVSGGHTTHYGFEFVHIGKAKGDTGRANGLLKFDRTWTRHYTDTGSSKTDGSGTADLLLGRAGSGYVDYNDTYYRSWPYFAWYAQHDWKVRRNLTLNLGLRYDVQVPFVERWDRVNSGFDFNTKNPYSDAVLANWKKLKAEYDATDPVFPYPDAPAELKGGKLFIGKGDSRRTYLTDWQNIQPRIGVAWAFAPKTVLRAGLGIYHRQVNQDNYTDGFSMRTNYGASFDGKVTPSGGLTGPYSLEDPFPGGLNVPTGSSLGLRTNAGNSISFDGRQRILPRTFQYSFGLQRWLPWSMKADLSYVGSQTVHDTMDAQLDYVSMEDYVKAKSNNKYLNRKIPNPFYGILPETSDLGKGPTLTPEDLLVPYPLFSSITQKTNPWARFRYDALQVRLEKRFFGNRRSGGLTTVLSYTFSKMMEATHRLNNWNLAEAPVHELSSYDKPQNLAFSGVLDLPFGKNRAFFSGTNRIARAIISNWNYNWVFTYYSGYPVGWPGAQFLCASYTPDGGQTPGHWFNNDPACYKGWPSYTLKTNQDRFPNIRNMSRPSLNMTIARTFRVRERWSLQLRGEAFNATNTPLFSGPSTDYTNPRFGMLPIEQKNFPRLIQIAAKLLF